MQTTLQKIKKELETLPGHLGFYFKDLKSGFEFGVNENDEFLAASVIKFPLFLHILSECEKGSISLETKITTEENEKFPSCGALNLFTGAVEADIATLCNLMICISDNTATNRLLRFCTMDGAKKGFAQLGLSKTTLRRFLFDSEAASRGLENTICPKEMGMLLEKLFKGEFINEKVSKYALDVLLKQQINHKICGKLKGVPTAHKTGEDYMLSNDVGIVLGENPFIICFAGHDTDVYKWEDFIRRSTFDLYNSL